MKAELRALMRKAERVIEEDKQFGDLRVLFIRRGVDLKKTRRGYVCCCPFHGEKTPSFWVNTDDSRYRCFGCGKHGTLVDLAKELRQSLSG